MSPYNRLDIQPEDQEAEVKSHDFYHAIIGYHTVNDVQYRGSFFKSSIKFRPEISATAPGAALRIKDSKHDAHYMLDFELHEFESVTAEIISIDDLYSTRRPRQEAFKALDTAMRAMEQELRRNDSHFFRFTLKRKPEHISHQCGDFACYSDTRADWTPSKEQAAQYHDNFQAYQPKQQNLSAELESALQDVKTAQSLTIWVALRDDGENSTYFREFEKFEHIIQNVARCGRDKIFRADWYWSKHELYRPRDYFSDSANDDTTRYFGHFWEQKKLMDPRVYPERQPWLQQYQPDRKNDAGTTYTPVWTKKSRFAGPHPYRCAYIPALLWEMEASAMLYSQQFSSENIYIAGFQAANGGSCLVKVRLSGPDVSTTHGQPQITPAAGSPVKVLIAGDVEEDDAFVGHVAEKTIRGFDFVLSCVPPRKHSVTPSGSMSVTLNVTYTSFQDSQAIQAISYAASRVEFERHEQPELDARGRANYRIVNSVGGRLAEELSRDFYQDWVDEHQRQPDFAATNAIITKQLPDSLNLEQRQAYLLALRGTRGAMLGIEGCPGTGKSHTLRAISVAMLLMGYSVMVSAQSNNGVDAVFSKISSWVQQYRRQWFDEGTLLRLGATTIDMALIDAILSRPSAKMDELRSPIQADNIPHSSAFKMATFMLKNPAHRVTTSFHAWAKGMKKQVQNFEHGQVRPIGDTDGLNKKSTMLELLQESVGKPRLVAATAAAANRDVVGYLCDKFDLLIFDEASQATEASFMMAATSEGVSFGLVILGGDHLQLPPVIKSKEQNPFGNVLEMSPLERLGKASHDRAVVNLIRNYRSHQQIVQLASTITYCGKMISGHANGYPTSELQESFIAALPQLVSPNMFKAASGSRVWFVDTPGFSVKPANSNSSWNPNGADFTARLANSIANAVGEDKVQIITMYGYEVGEIRKILATKWSKQGIHVQTVDSFQGKEENIVIVHCSAAFKDRHNPIGFLTDLRRLNVAITRAQDFMFIIGNLTFWEQRIQRCSAAKMKASVRDKKNRLKFNIGGSDGFVKMMDLVKKEDMVVKYLDSMVHLLPRSSRDDLYY